ncbi:dienelactone hydrolase [Sphingomonas sp. R3G8C]|uniref:alpha/beta hydrolase family protein n=1 Tax=Novosphingobium rhizosphaerae TaxID=1551649 RepID=UPI0015CD4B09
MTQARQRGPIDRGMAGFGRGAMALALALAGAMGAAPVPAVAQVAPGQSEPGLPELAAPGAYVPGTMTRTIVATGQLDAAAAVAAGKAVPGTRTLPLRIWYPARAKADARTVTYAASLTAEPPRPPVHFTIAGRAVADAPPAGQGFPLVVLSHGFDNDPVMLRWLGENLASKGYVVVAIAHHDGPITQASGAIPMMLRRPLDVVLTLQRLRAGLLGSLAATDQVALIGYSFGGYGVLTAAGARLDPAGPWAARLPAALRADYTGDGPRAEDLRVPGIAAVVAISPAGGGAQSAWGAGLAQLHAPLLVLAGTADRTVGYDPGPATIFAGATGADRTLLAFQGAGHALGTDPAPVQMRQALWDMDWFEDPVWRKARLNGISLHFITAFLAVNLQHQAAMQAYFDVPQERSDGAGWTGAETPYAAISAGGTNPTWKGFVRNHQNGLLLRHMAPAP